MNSNYLDTQNNEGKLRYLLLPLGVFLLTVILVLLEKRLLSTSSAANRGKPLTRRLLLFQMLMNG